MQLPESAEFASLVCRMRTAPDEKAASFLADLAAKGQVSPAEASQMLAKHNAKQAYETSMAMLDALLVDMKNGTVGPPKNPAPVAAAGKEKGKAPAKAPPAAPPAAAAGATAAGKQDKKKEGGAPSAGGSSGPEGKQGVKKEKVKKAAPPKEEGDGGERPVDVSWADIRVGKILDAAPHPDSDKLYVEPLDRGEASPRQVLSGLAQHMPLDQVKGAMVVCICNLRARKIAGTESQAMVLCASDAEKSKLCFVTPPPGSVPGEVVKWEGYPGEPEPNPKKIEKKKAWEAIQPLFATTADGTCVYKGEKAGAAAFMLPKGKCTSTVPNGVIS